ncbi:MAG: SRPBCC domain-containing protein [Bacteroidota bacterium]
MKTKTNNDPGKELCITKMLDAPIELVWEVWTNPEHIANWWAPAGFTNTIHTMNVTEGGEWRLTINGPDGKNYPNKSIFGEIVQQKKIVFQHYNPNYLATIVFEPHEKKTFMEWTMGFETTELFDTVVRVFKADEGLKQSVEKLSAYLETQLK